MTVRNVTLVAALTLLILAVQTISNSLPAQQYPMAYQERVLPPAQYDHDYDGELIIRHMSEREIYEQCRTAARDGYGKPFACSRAFLGEPKRCFVYMMIESDLAKLGWNYNIVMRHELGHCNGWKH